MPSTDESTLWLADLNTAATRLEAIELSPSGRDVVAASGDDLLAAVRRLVENGQVDDAAAVLGQTLTGRAAVWWACLVARREPAATTADRRTTENEEQALAAAESWVRSEGAVLASEARAAAEAAGLSTPAGAAAMAAFFAAGNLAPSGGQPVPPPAHVAGLFSSTAVILAAVRRKPVEAAGLKRQFVELGLAVAAGEHSWADQPAADQPTGGE